MMLRNELVSSTIGNQLVVPLANVQVFLNHCGRLPSGDQYQYQDQ